MKKKDYILFNARKGRKCSVKFLNSLTGEYMPAKSLGTSDRKEAERIVIEWLKNGIPGQGSVQKVSNLEVLNISIKLIQSEDFTFEDAEKILVALKDRGFVNDFVKLKDNKTPLMNDFVSLFWDYKNSPYVKKRHATGKSISESYCNNTFGTYKKHAEKYFEGVRLSEISRDQIEEFLLKKSDTDIASATLNTLKKSICQPLKYAYVKNIIKIPVHDGIVSFDGRRKERGILTRCEVEKLFSIDWADKKYYVANLLASQTGLRSGEVLALRKSDVGIDRLFVRHSFSEKEKLKSTKTGKTRVVPITFEMRDLLLSLANAPDNPGCEDGNAYIFYSIFADTPMNKKTLLNSLKEALLKIGITEKERRERNIVFHSWRHYVATYLANSADKRVSMQITGHETDRVFDEYSAHEDEGDFERMKNALKGLTKTSPGHSSSDTNITFG